MDRSGKVHFDGEQVHYLVEKTGEPEPSKAVEIFMTIIRELQVDPFKIHIYLKKLMDNDGWKTKS